MIYYIAIIAVSVFKTKKIMKINSFLNVEHNLLFQFNNFTYSNYIKN